MVCEHLHKISIPLSTGLMNVTQNLHYRLLYVTEDLLLEATQPNCTRVQALAISQRNVLHQSAIARHHTTD